MKNEKNEKSEENRPLLKFEGDSTFSEGSPNTLRECTNITLSRRG